MKQPVVLYILLLALASAGPLAAQNIQHERTAINIEVPVRVFKGDVFVDDLTIADFEIYEDGRLQSLEAVYLVKKTIIERREETKPFAPNTGRHFYLCFEMTEYDARIREALEFFVREVLIPGDELIIVTPMKTYRMKSEILGGAERNRIFNQLVGILRRDIQVGSTEYKDVIEDLQAIAQSMVSSVGLNEAGDRSMMMAETFSSAGTVYDVNTSFEEKLQIYAATLSRLETLRQADSAQFARLAEHLRSLPGKKEIFLFYQREFVPKLDPMVLGIYMSMYNDRPDIIQTVTGIFDFFRREAPLDIDSARKTYADSGAIFHFLYLTTPTPHVPGVVMHEQSEDLFLPFRELSRITGGYETSTANIAAAMRSAVAASENYYLVYYTPRDYRSDGLFRTIEVKVKGGGYRLSHRLGYIAD